MTSRSKKSGTGKDDSRKADPAQAGGNDQIQGEGDYRSAQRYDQSARAFAESGKVDEAARNAKPANGAQAQDLRDAEAQGLSHSKGEDPALPHAARSKEDKR